MVRKLSLPLILAFLALASLTACQSDSNRTNSTTFTDDSYAQSDSGEEIVPLITGSRDYTRLSPIDTPAVVLERQKARGQQPLDENKPLQCGGDAPFRIQQQKLVIDVDAQSMSFDFQVDSKRGSETIRLRGDFKRDSAPWRAELYAVDQALLKEKRVQAVVLCLTAHICDVIGVNIYYVIDGKPYCRQLQSGVSGPRVAMSGDEEETAETMAHEPHVGPVVPGVTDSATAEGSTREVGPAKEDIEEDVEYETDEDPASTGSVQLPPGVLDDTPATRPQTPITGSPRSNKPETSTPARPALESKPVSPVPAKKTVKVAPPIEGLTAAQLKNRAIEYPGRMKIDTPAENAYRIEGLPKAEPRTEQSAPKQAWGYHNRGKLYSADYMPLSGPGFIREAALSNPKITPDKDTSSAWGTKRTLEFIELLGNEVEKQLPGTKMVILSVARKLGGLRPGAATCYIDKKSGKRVCVGSHQTGLDIDIRYLNKVPTDTGRIVAAGKNAITAEFDVARNWELAKAVTRTRHDWTIVMFMDRSIKNALCKHAKASGETINDPNSVAYQTLRSITHWSGHKTHFHVRLYCPGSEGCSDTLVDLDQGNGCN